MHYYQFHIGDYLSHTAHLKPLEDLAYRRLLDLYYSTEIPISTDVKKVARLIRLPAAPVQAILDEFFELTDAGYKNSRADQEILMFQGFIEAGKRGAAKRWAKAPHSPPIEPPIPTNNHKPVTNNHKPLKILDAPEGVTTEVWNSFLEQRKKARAVVTPTVIKRIEQEAEKAGWTLNDALAECAARGWRGFSAKWVEHKFEDYSGDLPC